MLEPSDVIISQMKELVFLLPFVAPLLGEQ